MKFSFAKIRNAINLMPFHGQRTEFYGDLARSMRANELLVDFLRGELAIASAKQTANSARAYALQQMLGRIVRAEHNTPSKIIGLSMPQNDMIMLAAVDTASEKDFVRILNDLVDAITLQKTAKSELRAALRAPAVLIPGIAIFAYVLSSQAIPIIEKIAPPEVWTPFNSAVRFVANLISNGGFYAMLAAVVFIAGFVYFLPRWTGKLRMRLEQVSPSKAIWLTPIAPWLLPLSIYRDFTTVMVFSSLAVLLSTGKTLTEALETIAANGSPYLRYHVRRVLSYLDMYPLEVARAFSSGMLSPAVSARLATIARTEKSYADVLIKVGTTGNEQIRKEVVKSAKKLNVIFLSLAASLVMFLYGGQMSITQKMNTELDPNVVMQRKLEKEQHIMK